MATAPPPARRSGPPDIGTIGTPSLWIMGGLAIGYVANLIGGALLESGEDSQALFFAIGCIAFTPAVLLLAVRLVRAGNTLAAAGSGLLSIILVASQVAGYTGEPSEQVFSNMTLPLFAALVLIAADAWSPIWGRAAAALSGLLFLIYGLDYILQGPLAPADEDSPLAIIGWILFAVVVVSWILTVREEGDVESPVATRV